MHAIGELESARVHLTVPPGFTMRDEAVVLHHAELADADVTERTGFRVTTPIRSIIDVAAMTPDEDQLARVIDDARQKGLLTLRNLRSRAEAVDAKAALHIERAIQRPEAP